MFANKIIIKKAGIKDAQMLAALSITTFCETFMKDNKKEDMDKYLTEEMNLEKITGELKDENNLFFLAECNNETIGYVKMGIMDKIVGKSR